MKLKTTLLGKTYTFRDIKQVLAKANEEKTGDQLAGLASRKAVTAASSASRAAQRARLSRAMAAPSAAEGMKWGWP